MIFQLLEEQGDSVLLLDDEGLDYLEEGLAGLRHLTPGSERSVPSLVSVDDAAVGVGSFILRRA